MKLQQSYLADLVSLIFPNLCKACGASLMGTEQTICTQCLYDLPYTNFHLQADNPVARQFWGRVNLNAAYAMCWFTKGGKIQQLMHHFKYKGAQDVGVLLGKLAGKQLAAAESFKTVDIIVPVPLHKSRLRKRGYNQSLCFAEGLAMNLNAQVSDDNLIRIKATDTQTKRSRFARFQNMQEVFAVAQPELLKHKHILLVDDIMTTGSTLEACCTKLLKIEGVKVSIATIAYAE